MTAIWWLYLAALVAELGGLTLGLLDLSGRVRKIGAFSKPDPPVLPAGFNEHPSVARIHASSGLEKAIQGQRETNNELINAVRDLMNYTSAVDDELEKLAGVGESLGWLWAAAGLILVSAVLGGVANLLTVSGVG